MIIAGGTDLRRQIECVQLIVNRLLKYILNPQLAREQNNIAQEKAFHFRLAAFLQLLEIIFCVQSETVSFGETPRSAGSLLC